GSKNKIEKPLCCSCSLWTSCVFSALTAMFAKFMTEGRRCQVHLLDDRKLELLVQDATMTPLGVAWWKRSLIELMESLISHPLCAFDPIGLFIKLTPTVNPHKAPPTFEPLDWEKIAGTQPE
ncbi:hypothetical protein E2320_005776, partial [Naja naja]